MDEIKNQPLEVELEDDVKNQPLEVELSEDKMIDTSENSMGQVLEKLQMTDISVEPNSEKIHENMYKNKGKNGSQEERRKEILETQKESRNTKLDTHRGIIYLLNANEAKSNIFKPTNAHYRPKIYVAGFSKTSPSYRDVLMLSEWFIEKPEDFHENWLMVPCPKGTRMLVVATRGITRIYTKYGYFKKEVYTSLPGGNPYPQTAKDPCCVLDCIYYDKINTMYVLDILAWNRQPMTDGETNFRHYWLKSHIDDRKDLTVINDRNEIIFKLLPMVSCERKALNDFFTKYPPFENDSPLLDGLLFYHKEAHYVGGETPLVGWLYPYMIPEILGPEIMIHEKYAQKPQNYTNQAAFIAKFEAKQARWKQRPRRQSCMDTSEADEKQTESMATEDAKSEIKQETESCEKMEEEQKELDQKKMKLGSKKKKVKNIVGQENKEECSEKMEAEDVAE